MQMLNWDWSLNRPQTIPQTNFETTKDGSRDSTSHLHLSGFAFWENVKKVLLPPLIDPRVKEEALGAWLDEHTMLIHSRLSSLIPKIRAAPPPSSGFILEDDEYWNILQEAKQQDAQLGISLRRTEETTK